MADLIRWIKSRSQRVNPEVNDASGQSGFVYVGNGETGPMVSASAGASVGNFTDRPPWIVVDHTIETPILAKWPGRLWRVRILRKGAEQPLAYAAYTRATAVHVEEEVPLAALFEHNGEEVVHFLNRVQTLSAEEKMRLANSRDEQAEKLHNQVWDRWLAKVDAASPHRGQDHSGIIAMGSRPPRSPVGSATSVLSAELRKRARHMDGDSAFVIEDEEQTFNADWLRVASHLQHTLFAIGASAEVVSEAEREILSRAYEAFRFSHSPQ